MALTSAQAQELANLQNQMASLAMSGKSLTPSQLAKLRQLQQMNATGSSKTVVDTDAMASDPTWRANASTNTKVSNTAKVWDPWRQSTWGDAGGEPGTGGAILTKRAPGAAKGPPAVETSGAPAWLMPAAIGGIVLFLGYQLYQRFSR